MELHPHLAVAAAEAARIARGAQGTPSGAPTPCADMDLGALLNHWVLYSAYGLEKRARREPLPEEWLARDFAASPDWADAYAAQLDRAVAAWAEPAVWEGEVEVAPGASFPAATIVGLIIKELTVHGWDVAKATGQTVQLPEDTAKVVLSVVEEHADVYRQYDGFADPVEVPADAPVFDRALALSGRDPGWRPAQAG
jgi:uncharacterized protein (TIGR03086 family)